MTVFFHFINSIADVDILRALPGAIYLTATGDLFVYGAGGNQLGGIWQSIGNIFKDNSAQIIAQGMQVASTFFTKPTSQAKGLAGINNFGNQVIGKLNELIAAASNGMPRNDVYTAADTLVNVLSDSSAVYQAKNGDDAAALRNFKQQAGELASQAKAAADAVATAQTQQQPGGTITAPNGQQQQQQTPNGQIIYPGQQQQQQGGIDTNTLLIIAAAFGLILLIK